MGLNFGSTILTKFSLFGIGIMLARLLGPHAFGVYAVAYVALLALLTFNELGVSLAIVRWEGDPKRITPTVTTISLAVSILIYVGCFIVAPMYASAMGAPEATEVIRVLALAVLSDAFTNTPAALLQRSFRQGRRVIADQVNAWLGTAITITLAWMGYGAMSLAIGRVCGCVAGAVLLVSFEPGSVRLGFDRASFWALLRFGLPLAGANIVTFAVTCVDQIVVGHVLGTVALGFYVLALNLASWPVNVFSQPLRSIGPAVFSRLQHDQKAMRTTFTYAAGLLCAAALPVCVLISGSAKPIISFVYGFKWLPASQPLMWLALLAAVQVFFLLVYDYLVVLARSRFLLVIQFVWLLILVPALFAGARIGGIDGAAVAETAVASLGILPWYLAELARGGMQLRALAKQLWLPLAGTMLAGCVVIGSTELASSNFVALAASGAATVTVIGALLYGMRRTIHQLRSVPNESIASAVVADRSALPDTEGDSQPHHIEMSDMLGIASARDANAESINGIQHSRDAFVSRSARYDVTGPLPIWRGDFSARPPLIQDSAATSPLYHATVASLLWDPATTHHRGESRMPAHTATGWGRESGTADPIRRDPGGQVGAWGGTEAPPRTHSDHIHPPIGGTDLPRAIAVLYSMSKPAERLPHSEDTDEGLHG